MNVESATLSYVLSSSPVEECAQQPISSHHVRPPRRSPPVFRQARHRRLHRQLRRTCWKSGSLVPWPVRGDRRWAFLFLPAPNVPRIRPAGSPPMDPLVAHAAHVLPLPRAQDSGLKTGSLRGRRSDRCEGLDQRRHSVEMCCSATKARLSSSFRSVATVEKAGCLRKYHIPGH